MIRKADKKVNPFPNLTGFAEKLGVVEQPEGQPLKTVRGVWPFRERWYSICSAHHPKLGRSSACPRCRTGTWRNTTVGAFSSLVYKISPRLWRWYVNR